ncbi:NRDE family protein [Bacillus sp. FJAT-45037]|uniref:NRDE family protein n=1 Tax=Bacillus sp. FJAT-45037 TaxID=2011007 RepID=UPI0012FE1DA5|nr:NRDE family protein [Bacillus sp. FJAT-45037]
MCLLVLTIDMHDEYPLIVAANRDEFYQRPTKRAHFWSDGSEVFAGRDEERGGTWLGVTNKGRFAAVTNVREPINETETKEYISRGDLVKVFLQSNHSAKDYMETIAKNKDDYQGFNLIVKEGKEIYYYSNRIDAPKKLHKGTYVLSNATLNVEWPKTNTLKENVSVLLKQSLDKDQLINGLIEQLQNKTKYDEHDLPVTGVGRETERLLSTVFITSETYGTRASTVVLEKSSEDFCFVEQGYGPNGIKEHRVVQHVLVKY